MSASSIIFYILAALVLTFGALTVFSRKIFRSAVFLLLSLICIAGIYILLEMDFVAALQIVIYVGGIVVLIIFSIFLTQKSGESLPKRLPRELIWAILLPVAGLAFSTWAIVNHTFTQTGTAPIEPTVHNIGLQLINYDQYGYVLPFEAVSVLLLACLVGSIVIAMRKKQQ